MAYFITCYSLSRRYGVADTSGTLALFVDSLLSKNTDFGNTSKRISTYELHTAAPIQSTIPSSRILSIATNFEWPVQKWGTGIESHTV